MGGGRGLFCGCRGGEGEELRGCPTVRSIARSWRAAYGEGEDWSLEMLHKVSDLPLEARGVVETLIGRPLAENEAFSIRPISLQKEGVDAHRASEIADRLEQYFGEIDRQHAAVSEGEFESAVDEAMRSVRPGYTPLR